MLLLTYRPTVKPRQPAPRIVCGSQQLPREDRVGSQDLGIKQQQRRAIEDLLSVGNADCRLALSTGGQFPATGTNDDAAAGDLGEVMTATAAPGAVNLSTGTAANVATLAGLTGGDWDVDGVVNYTPTTGTSVTQLAQGASTSTGALGAQDTYSQDLFAAIVPGSGNLITKVIPTQRIKVAAGVSTPIYLVAKATFSVAALTAGGTIRARRPR